MSRLEQLIQKLCPDGVTFRKLSEILSIKNGRDYKEFDEGYVPVYGSGDIMTYINQYAYDKPSVLIPRKGSLDKLYYVDVPFWTVDTIFYTKINITLAVPKYVFYYLQMQHLERLNNAGGVPSLTQTILNNIRIPVPPLAVQREIVRILDSFTELTAELTARKKQYEYYRDLLLTFDDATARQTDLSVNDPRRAVKWLTLEEVADIGTGSSNTNEELEVGYYPFYVRSQDVRRKNTFEYDETAIITSGDGVGVGKIFHFIEGKYALHQRAYRIHITDKRILPKFYFYYMKSTFLPYIEKTSFHSSVTSIRRPMLNNFPVPIPPLEEQARIVTILDRFDAICHDMTIGLPAEIEARRKQYAYYRDQLLTFKEKAIA